MAANRPCISGIRRPSHKCQLTARENTMPNFNRRDALKMSAGFAAAAAAGGFSCIEMAKAGPIEGPTIDKLSVRGLVDSASHIFFKPQAANGVKTEPGRSSDSLRPRKYLGR